MIGTAPFLVTLSLMALATWTLLAVCRSPALAHRMAHGFALVCGLAALVSLGAVLAVTWHAPPSAAFYRAILGVTAYAAVAIAGVAVAAAMAALVRAIRPVGAANAASAFVTSPRLAAGLAFFVALAFAGFEVGKAAHDAEMRQFFLGSGYTVGFMYLVMLVESVGALGMLVARLRLAASILLALVMAGAIATHARNGDPFSDSLDALRMLLLVASVALLETCRSRLRSPADAGPAAVAG